MFVFKRLSSKSVGIGRRLLFHRNGLFNSFHLLPRHRTSVYRGSACALKH